MKYDLLLHGSGATWPAFVGACEGIAGSGHSLGRIMGVSGGALAGALIAAGYSPAEMLELLEERANGAPVFAQFLAEPTPLAAGEIRARLFDAAARGGDSPQPQTVAEGELADAVVSTIAQSPWLSRLIAFFECGGWHSAGGLIGWLAASLDAKKPRKGRRKYGAMTLAQFFVATQVELSLVASDTTMGRMLVLNHTTAPDVPLVAAVHMSISIPLFWPEVIWDSNWGEYQQRDLTGHAIMDGSLLAGFPIELLISDEPTVTRLMGSKEADAVLGLLVDDSLPVPQPASEGEATVNLQMVSRSYVTWNRILRLINTVTSPGDNLPTEEFEHLAVRLPAGGYGSTEFAMSDERRQVLVQAGRAAVDAYFGPLTMATSVALPPEVEQRVQSAANQTVVENSVRDLTLPADILGRLREPLEALGFAVEEAVVSDPRDFRRPQTYTYTAIRRGQAERIIVHLLPRALDREYIYHVLDKITLLGAVFRRKTKVLYVCSQDLQSAPAEIRQLLTNHWPQFYQISGEFLPWDDFKKLGEASLDEQKYELLKGSLNLEELLSSEPLVVEFKGAQEKEFLEALISAFPSFAVLRQMVVLQFYEPASLVNDNLSLATAIFELLQWAKANGKNEALLRAAYAANPGNPDLGSFVKQFLPDLA